LPRQTFAPKLEWHEQENIMLASNFVWHYTVGTRLSAISDSGQLIPTRSPHAGASLGVLWFSRQQKWEPSTARTAWMRHQAARAAFPLVDGLYRFGLPATDSRLIPWPTVTRVADIDIPEAMAMVSAGLRRGACPTDWLGALSAIPLSGLRFQRWNGEAWQDADLQEAAQNVRAPGKPVPAAGRLARMPTPRSGAMHDVH